MVVVLLLLVVVVLPLPCLLGEDADEGDLRVRLLRVGLLPLLDDLRGDEDRLLDFFLRASSGKTGSMRCAAELDDSEFSEVSLMASKWSGRIDWMLFVLRGLVGACSGGSDMIDGFSWLSVYLSLSPLASIRWTFESSSFSSRPRTNTIRVPGLQVRKTREMTNFQKLNAPFRGIYVLLTL